MTIRFECFGMTILRASAFNLADPRDPPEGIAGGVLVLALPNNGKISLFMPFETAEQYANALNACNDREVANARENINTDA